MFLNENILASFKFYYFFIES